MKNSVPVIVAALAILASQGIAQKPQDQKTTEAAPVVIKYDKMEKTQLQAELKKLQKALLVAEQAAKQAITKRDVAKKAYDTASNARKPDALLRMLEADAKSRKPVESLMKMRKDFGAAQQAYINLLLAEQK